MQHNTCGPALSLWLRESLRRVGKVQSRRPVPTARWIGSSPDMQALFRVLALAHNIFFRQKPIENMIR